VNDSALIRMIHDVGLLADPAAVPPVGAPA
jgi:hypothetical protein